MIAKQSPYRMGWLLVMFDLPVLTKQQRKEATDFRKALLDDGYCMVQFSIYARACPSLERIDKHTKRLEVIVPHGGNVRYLFLTDKQWEQGGCVRGPDYRPGQHPETMDIPAQIEFW